MPVSNQNAPFKKSPEYNRDSFLRPPDWRWQQAKQLVYAQVNNLPYTAATDVIVMYASRLQKACRIPATRQFIRTKMPDAWHIITLGISDTSSQLRAQIQACIIYGLSPQETSRKLKWPTSIQAALYRDLFCDLTGVQGLTGWFQQMLLQPARNAKSMNLFRARALAHYHSLQAALHSLRFGNAGKSAKQAMDAMWRSARNTQLFDYIAKELNVPIQVYVQTMQQSIKSRQDQAFILQSKQGSGQTQAMIDISKALDTSIRGFSQAQIKTTDPTSCAGIDFTADYMKHILNKQKA